MIEYTYSRLTFQADIIEPLSENDMFAVHTKDGTFQFTKKDFYREFSNVVKSKSYKEGRLYNYPKIPKKAMSFLISSQNTNIIKAKNSQPKDLVGDEIRSMIKNIGMLWRNSPNNPQIDGDVLKKWNKLIEEWIAADDMPLIIRKETNKRGQSIIHPCGREIIVSDNTVARWVYSNVINGRVFSLSNIKMLLKQNELPIVFIATKEIKEKAKYSKSLGSNTLKNWKLCHIEHVGFNTNTSIEDLDISDIKEHFKKYVNPNNMFVLPKEIGDLGEIDVFIEEQKKKKQLLTDL